MVKIRDYTKSQFAGISSENRIVLRKENPQHNPLQKNPDVPRYEFEMISFEELEKIKSEIDTALEERIKGMAGKETPDDVYYLQHNQARLAQILEDAYKQVQRRTEQKIQSLLSGTNQLPENLVNSRCLKIEKKFLQNFAEYYIQLDALNKDRAPDVCKIMGQSYEHFLYSPN